MKALVRVELLMDDGRQSESTDRVSCASVFWLAPSIEEGNAPLCLT